MRDAGFPEAAIAKAKAEALREIRTGTFVVHPDNRNAVRLFQGMATQWNMIAVASLVTADVIRVGLRYEVLDRVARGLGIDEQPDDFLRLQIMEGEALAALAGARR